MSTLKNQPDGFCFFDLIDQPLLLTNAQNEIDAMQCIGYDKAEIVNIEKNLIQTEYQLKPLLDYIPDIVLVHLESISLQQPIN